MGKVSAPLAMQFVPLHMTTVFLPRVARVDVTSARRDPLDLLRGWESRQFLSDASQVFFLDNIDSADALTI